MRSRLSIIAVIALPGVWCGCTTSAPKPPAAPSTIAVDPTLYVTGTELRYQGWKLPLENGAFPAFAVYEKEVSKLRIHLDDEFARRELKARIESEREPDGVYSASKELTVHARPDTKIAILNSVLFTTHMSGAQPVLLRVGHNSRAIPLRAAIGPPPRPQPLLVVARLEDGFRVIFGGQPREAASIAAVAEEIQRLRAASQTPTGLVLSVTDNTRVEEAHTLAVMLLDTFPSIELWWSPLLK